MILKMKKKEKLDASVSYLECPSTSSKQAIQHEVQSFSNPGSSSRISDPTDGTQHTSFASATVEVQY